MTVFFVSGGVSFASSGTAVYDVEFLTHGSNQFPKVLHRPKEFIPHRDFCETLGPIIAVIVHVVTEWFALGSTVQANQLGCPTLITCHEKHNYSFRCCIS